MPAFKDITGLRFGRLTALKVDDSLPHGRLVNKKIKWICECDCGNRKSVAASSLGRMTKSCGCYRSETSKLPRERICLGCGKKFKTRTTKIDYVVCSLSCRIKLGIKKKSQSECWPWVHLQDKDGYGEFWFSGKKYRAHRVAFAIEKGGIPHGKGVLHSCDNPPCCNPDHLYIGTVVENTADMDRRGRRVVLRGEDAGGSKLTESQVKIIKKSNLSARKLAARFGVKDQCIYKIRQGVNWTHVP
ncbi:MAG: HNH endonuclease signature motif containing protein [Xanthobacteraceae bacterium]|nr:HNH endonuclease signature motif containing protein [Xanthobacteraceae bacterium]